MPHAEYEFLEITTTTATEDEARRIAAALIERRVAACVHILGPMTSVYRWQGQVETATEYRCVAKSRASGFAQAVSIIQDLHSYEVPQITAVPIVGSSASYQQWLTDETA